jgi:hypothetical protein
MNRNKKKESTELDNAFNFQYSAFVSLLAATDPKTDFSTKATAIL